MIRGLISRQPVWKTVVIGVSAIALVLGVSLSLPSLTAESAYAQAEEIVQNSPEVHKVLGEEGEIEVINIEIDDLEGTVIARGEAGTVSAMIDLETNSVTQVVCCIADDQAAIEIANADPKVQELLDAGATIGDVSTMYVYGVMGNVATGETEDMSGTLVTVDINSETGDSYIAYVDLAEGKVEKLLKSVPMDAPSGPETFSVPDEAVQ